MKIIKVTQKKYFDIDPEIIEYEVNLNSRHTFALGFELLTLDYVDDEVGIIFQNQALGVHKRFVLSEIDEASFTYHTTSFDIAFDFALEEV